jgi:heme-binding HmuY-like protein
MKRTLSTICIVLLGSVGLYACGGDDDDNNDQPAGSSGAAGAGGGAAGGAGGGASGAGGGGAGGGAAGSTGGGTSCQAARSELLLPVDEVSAAEVIVTDDGSDAKTVFVDASVGGSPGVADNPRVYITLADAKRVDVSDIDAAESSDWDLALERSVIFANSGDGGPGGRTVALVAKAFDDVTAADATGAAFAAESFLDLQCSPKEDLIGAPLTTFSDWYEYDQEANTLTPKDQTYLVRVDAQTTFKVAIDSFYTNDDGEPQTPAAGSPDAGKFLLRIAPLTP